MSVSCFEKKKCNWKHAFQPGVQISLQKKTKQKSWLDALCDNHKLQKGQVEVNQR